MSLQHPSICTSSPIDREPSLNSGISSDLYKNLGLSGDQLQYALEVHQNILAHFNLHLDDRISDGVTTKELIHFTHHPDVVIRYNKIGVKSRSNDIRALNLGQYLWHGNPQELLGAFTHRDDQGIVFIDNVIRYPWNHAYINQQYRESTTNHIPLPIEIVDTISLEAFFKTYGYNLNYQKNVRQALGADFL